jgi:PAS domain S-box-containing protein
LVGASVALRNAILGNTGEPNPDLLLLAVAIAGALGGLGPAAVATAVGLLEEIYFQTEPVRTFLVPKHRDQVELTIFVVSGTAIGVTFEVLRRIRKRESAVRRTLAMITCCNEAILRATTEDGLYADVCKVIVDVGGYRMCWVGLAEHDERKTVRPVAHAGHEDGYLGLVDIVWADEPRGRRTTGTAIREKRIVVGQNLSTDPSMAPWREEAQRRGYRSVTSLPLILDGTVLGAIVMYSGEVAGFADDELGYLKRLTDDVTFGVGAIRQRAARERQEVDLVATGRALKASEERFQTYVDAAPLGIFVVDGRGRYQDCNPAALEMIGVDGPALRSMSISDLLDEADRPAALAGFGALVATGRMDLDTRLRRKDGSYVWVSLHGVKIAEDRYMALCQDITERLRSMDTLRESEGWLRMSQDIARLGHYVFDVRKDHWSSSTALNEIFGIDPGFPRTGADWLRIVHLDDRAAMGRYLEDLLSGGSRFDHEYRVVDQATKRVKWVHGIGDLERSADGTPVRLVGTIQDVTDRKVAEEGRLNLQKQLAHSARLAAMGTLVAGVAHEINNPLSGVLAGGGLAMELAQEARRLATEGAAADRGDLARLLDETVDSLQDAQQGGQRIAHIVKDLSLFARPDPMRARVRIIEIVDQAMRWLPVSVGRAVTLRVEDCGAPDVMASFGQVGQVIVNLVTNAAKATPRGRKGEVVVRLGPGHLGMARVEVIDDGVGMAPDVTERIFDPFFTTSPAGEGTGLGLPISHAIVTAHGGTISVQSELGKGSTFRVELPAAPSDA